MAAAAAAAAVAASVQGRKSLVLRMHCVSKGVGSAGSDAVHMPGFATLKLNSSMMDFGVMVLPRTCVISDATLLTGSELSGAATVKLGFTRPRSDGAAAAIAGVTSVAAEPSSCRRSTTSGHLTCMQREH